MRTHALLLWGWGTLGALAAGCAECEEDYDCPGTEVCNVSRGACEAFTCLADDDCAPGHRCADNACSPRTPTAPPDAPDALVIPNR